MIVSASRRTDIPALYSGWLEQRLDAGWCDVPNPFNRKQVARVSLRPQDVDAFVFWTRHARPMLRLLPRLDAAGYRYYFQYTLTGYGPPVERRTPPLEVAVRSFRTLASRLPPGAVVWRYDPILLGPAFPAADHLERFSRIAGGVAGYAERVVVSVVDLYRKTERRLGRLYRWDDHLAREPHADPTLPALLTGLVERAAEHGLCVEACAQAADWSDLGVHPTRCVDDRLLGRLFGGDWPSRKDPGQRNACRCVPSKDIGVPDTCTFGCAYCYATRSDATARTSRREHDPQAPSLANWLR